MRQPATGAGVTTMLRLSRAGWAMTTWLAVGSAGSTSVMPWRVSCGVLGGMVGAFGYGALGRLLEFADSVVIAASHDEKFEQVGVDLERVSAVVKVADPFQVKPLADGELFQGIIRQ